MCILYAGYRLYRRSRPRFTESRKAQGLARGELVENLGRGLEPVPQSGGGREGVAKGVDASACCAVAFAAAAGSPLAKP